MTASPDPPEAAPSVFIIGAGRAGSALAAAFHAAAVPLVGVHGRLARAAEDGVPAISTGPLPSSVVEADVILLAVRDAQLSDVIAELAAALPGGVTRGAIVLHASGGEEPSLEPVRRLGMAAGTFHPLVPLRGAAGAQAALYGAWIGIDGDDRARQAARALVTAVGAHAVDIPAGEKPAYHAAAVLASNFPAVLLALARDLLVRAGVRAEEADGAVHALFAAAAGNVRGQPLDAASVARLLTGPVARGDVDVVVRQLQTLGGRSPSTREVYAALTAAAAETMRAGQRAVPRLDEIIALARSAARDD